MKRAFLVMLIVTLSACGADTANVHDKPAVTADNAVDSGMKLTNKTELKTEESPKYLAKNESGLSDSDMETAYEMCMTALTDYYKAVWNGSEIDLDTFMDNENLKQYTQKKIQYQYDLHKDYNYPKNSVQDVEFNGWEGKFTDDEEGGFFYFLLPANIKRSTGAFGEPTELLVRNSNGRLVIVDWYTGAKDSYDFMVRGENETIANPTIWNDGEWVRELVQKQNDF